MRFPVKVSLILGAVQMLLLCFYAQPFCAQGALQPVKAWWCSVDKSSTDRHNNFWTKLLKQVKFAVTNSLFSRSLTSGSVHTPLTLIFVLLEDNTVYILRLESRYSSR